MEKCTEIANSGEYVEIEDGNILNTLLMPAQKEMLRVSSLLLPPQLLKGQNKKQLPRPVKNVIIKLEPII